jgi:hypothetical protein
MVGRMAESEGRAEYRLFEGETKSSIHTKNSSHTIAKLFSDGSHYLAFLFFELVKEWAHWKRYVRIAFISPYNLFNSVPFILHEMEIKRGVGSGPDQVLSALAVCSVIWEKVVAI